MSGDPRRVGKPAQPGHAAHHAPAAPAGPTPGLAEVEHVVKTAGATDDAAGKVALVVQAHPSERAAIMTWLQQTAGNGFVQKVVHAPVPPDTFDWTSLIAAAHGRSHAQAPHEVSADDRARLQAIASDRPGKL
ncbi:MAG TPA: hypothetical protein VLX92_03140, partial [Kofleriaceae bacterium]|nr:hypothetical protein [Kofleriaceae bacterium]